MQGSMVDWSCAEMKKKIMVVSIILALGILIFGKGLLVQNVYIDVIGKGENGYSRIELNKEESEVIRKIISPKIPVPDKGFVFAEGHYRIVFEIFGLELHMYPYIGDPETIRVGDKGHWFLELNFFRENESDMVVKIVNKYTEGDGICAWSNVK